MNEEIYINEKNYKEYLNLPIIAFSFAYGGAQGVGGEILVITSDGGIYSMNHVFGNMTIEMCEEVCLPLKYCCFGYVDVEKTPEGWKGIKLGAGNFLVLADSIYFKIKEELLKMAPHIRYGRWIDMVLDCINKL